MNFDLDVGSLLPLRALPRALASVPYGVAVRLRHALYDCGLLATQAAPLPVVSIGGLEAGGTGKTPMAGLVLRKLLDAGLRPGLLTRGYRRSSRGLQLRAVGTWAHVAALGDEATMLVRSGLDVAVAACAHRGRGARALQALGCQVAVMDDGLSHRQLGRALNIVMLRAEQPLQRAHLLPWGSLREPTVALRRADLIVLHHRDATWPPGEGAAVPEWLCCLLQELGCRAPVLVSQFGPPVVRDGRGQPQEVAGVPVVAAAGTARPKEVLRALEGRGAQVRGFFPYPDHHPFGPAAQRELQHAVGRLRARALIVTAKDAVKLPQELGAPVWTLHRELLLHDPNDLMGAALGRVFEGHYFSLPSNTLPHPPDTSF